MNDRVTLICELGVNHDGSFEKALRMIDAAKAAGVSIVKFQYYDPITLLGPSSPYLTYAIKCQFTKESHERLKHYCDLLGMEYLVSVFDIKDIPWADTLCKRHKVASRMNKNEAFIEALRNTGKEVIISTQSYTPSLLMNVRYMYCITKYPTPESELDNLPCNRRLGLSSHCPSIQPTLAAIAKGATVVEHHVTFDRKDEGCDHSSSITFSELAALNLFANKLEVIS
jgi:sialic acid synthase SpsE